MDNITGSKMVEILKDVAPDAPVFVSYLAGRPPCARACDEARRSIEEEGISPRHFTGAFKGLWYTKRGVPILTLWVEERDSIHPDGTVTRGAYRAFNPALGTLLTLAVL